MNEKYDSLFDGPAGPMDASAPDFIALLEQYAAEGRLDDLFQPFQQEQSVLEQQMAMAQGLREPGPRRTSPIGAALGGVANALGNIGGTVLQQRALEGQQALGGRMQKDASGRMEALLAELRRRKPAASQSMMATPDDATLATLMGGG